MGRHTSIAHVPGSVTASMQPIFEAASGRRMMPSVSRSTLCRNDTAPATAWPAPEMTLGASVYQPKLRVQALRQQLGGEILVDDGACALQVVALRPVDGDTASAAANDYLARLHQRTDGLDLHNGFGLGRGHAAAPAPACVLHDAVAPAAHLLRLLLSHKGTDGLGGILESRIRRVYLHLGEDGGHGLLDAAVQQFLPQAIS